MGLWRDGEDMDDDVVFKRPQPIRFHVAKRRCCLKCREDFESAWPGERVCAPCKKGPEWRHSSQQAVE
jgi:hypothetical protein